MKPAIRFEISVLGEASSPVIYLKDTHTGSSAEIFCFGALLNAFHIPLADGTFNVVDGFADVETAAQQIANGFQGAKLSPFVCRMNKGAYHFDNHSYQVHKHFLGSHAIHGLIFDAVFDIASTEMNEDHAAVTLVHHYKGEDTGYPFSYSISITWQLAAGNSLTVRTAIEHKNRTAIPVADGWHPYFTLGGTVDEWTLQFTNSQQLEYDSEVLPTGKKIADDRFLHGTLLKDIVLDNGFIFTDAEESHQCVLSNDRLALTIRPDKNYPVLQVYTPPHRQSIAIENLSGAPDNFNNGMGLIILPPGDIAVFTTTYIVTAL